MFMLAGAFQEIMTSYTTTTDQTRSCIIYINVFHFFPHAQLFPKNTRHDEATDRDCPPF
jgi:hypothetical protein